MVIIDPSRDLLILGVYGRLVCTLCHVHNSRVQQELHTKQYETRARSPVGAAEGCVFVVVQCAILVGRVSCAHGRAYTPTYHIHKELTGPLTEPGIFN